MTENNTFQVWVANGRTFSDLDVLAEAAHLSRPDVPLETIRGVLDLPHGLNLLGYKSAGALDAVEALTILRDKYKEHSAAVRNFAEDRKQLVMEMVGRGVDADTILLCSDLPASTIIDWFYEAERDEDGNVVKEMRTVREGNCSVQKMLPKKVKVDDRLIGEREAELRKAAESISEMRARQAKRAREAAKEAARASKKAVA